MPVKKPVTDARPDPAGREQLTTTFVELAIRIGALGLVLYWTLILLLPFLTIGIWSAVLTVALYPAFEWMARRLGGRRRLAAVLITILSLLVVIGPATWLAFDLVESLRMISDRIDLSTLAFPAPPASVKDWPLIGDPIFQFWNLASTNLAEALAKIVPQLKPVGTVLLGIAADAGTGILNFFVAIIVTGFLFAPAPSIIDVVKKFLRRLVPERGEEFANLAGATIRAVSRGVIGISVLQALLAGIGLMVAGVPAASVITSAVLVLGIIQIGPAIVLVPVVIWSWFSMEPATAILFTAYMVPVNLLDNILKPIVMGRGLKTPMVVILIGLLGGTLAYGITGLFLGPIILAVIWELLVAWIREGEAS
jgi:predicted PurR-regulated permease PerM